MTYDVIIVGAGPGGGSAAILLAKRGHSVLLLDKAEFPRDKVCGDGLTPQALYWLDILGCVEDVLEQTNSYITECDLFINSEYILTGRFPQDGPYPGFGTCLERKILDNILVDKAISHGVDFKSNCRVNNILWCDDWIEVEAVSKKKNVRFAGKILIGADGANSIISRAIGNVVHDGTSAVSVRTYFKDVKGNGSPVKIYFNKQFFPGYGWIFIDDRGSANVGLGYAYDKNFPLRLDLKEAFWEFVNSDLRSMLQNATQIGQLTGWWSGFYKTKSVVADRVMLIGDAANFADPMNGGGIHKAMESAYIAAQIVDDVISSGDCSKQALLSFQRIWNERSGLDWRIGELLLSIAKNPHLKEFYLLAMKSLGRLIKEDQQFQDFCSGIFCGVVPRRNCFSPGVLLEIFPLNPSAWFSIFPTYNGGKIQFPFEYISFIMRDMPKITSRIVRNPLKNIEWGIEVFIKMIGLTEKYIKGPEINFV